MDNKIKIGVDIGTVKRSIFDISASIDKAFGKGKGFDIFSKDTKKFLLSEASRAINDMTKEMDKLAKRAERYHRVLQNANVTEERALIIKRKLFNLERDRTKFKQDIEHLEEGKQAIGTGSMGKMGKILTAIPGAGSLLSKMGMGAGSLGGLGALAAAGFILNRGIGGYGAFAASAPQRLGLMGRGITDVSGVSPQAQALGFSPTDVRGAQEQGIGIFGSEASQTGSKQLNDRLKFSRQTGMDPSQIQGMFSGVQSQSGFKGANKAFEEFKATILADKLTHELAPYIEAVSGLLDQINQDGMGLTGDAIRSIATIAGKGENVSAQQVSRMLSGLDATIKNSEGPVRAFYMNAFAKAGIGGKTLGGAEVATRLGLFGGSEAGMQNYQKQGLMGQDSIDLYKRLGLTGQGAVKQRAAAISDAFRQIDQLYKVSPSSSQQVKDQNSLAKHLVEQYYTQSKTPMEGEAKRRALEQMAGAKTEKEYSDLATKFEDQFGEKSMEDMMKSSEGHLIKIEGYSQAAAESLGKDISKPINDIQKLVADVDRILGAILKPLADIVGIVTRPLGTVTGKVAEGLEGSWGANIGSGIYDVLHPSMKSKVLNGSFSQDEVQKMGSVDRGDLERAAQDALKDIKTAEDNVKNKPGMEMTGQALSQKDKELTGLLEMIKTISAEQLKTLQDQYKHSTSSHEENKRIAQKPKASKNPKDSTMDN